MRSVFAALMLVVFVAVSLTGCFDPEPSEISIIATMNGERQGVTVQVFNSKGLQIQEVSTDWGGIGYISQLAPGTYTLKFVDKQGGYYPAERTVHLSPGESVPCEVELSEAPPAVE
jgi:hypothetical protein